MLAVGGLGATCVGNPEKVADEMERWVNEGDVDGFNIVSQTNPFCAQAKEVKLINFHPRPTPSCPAPSPT